MEELREYAAKAVRYIKTIVRVIVRLLPTYVASCVVAMFVTYTGVADIAALGWFLFIFISIAANTALVVFEEMTR